MVLGVMGMGRGMVSQAQPVFTDVTEAAGLARPHTGMQRPGMGLGGGAAWFDYDNDGDLDLYVTQRSGPNQLYRNDGGIFVDVAPLVGADDPDHDGAGVAAADYDNDGWTDLYLANSNADVLLRNEGGTFVDVTATAFQTDPRRFVDGRGTSAAWGDYDADGYLDLYVAQHQHLGGMSGDRQDRLFHNNGDGTFTDVSHLLGIDYLIGFGFIGGWTDYDGDGDADLFLINDCLFGGLAAKPTYLFRNDGGLDGESWLFTEVSAETGTDHCIAGMGLATGDYDRDGDLDYFYTDIGPPLLLQNQGGSFVERTSEAGVDIGFYGDDPLWTWGTNFFDADLDGYLDLFVAAGHLYGPDNDYRVQPDLFYWNNGDGTFTEYAVAAGVADTLTGRSSVVGDYDGDGDPDLYVVNYGQMPHLWRNEGAAGHHGLIVDLEGVASNRDGVGAFVTVRTPDGVEQVWETRSGSSLGGGDDRAAYFGLGANTSVAELVIRWPSGIVQTLTDVAADQRLKVVEAGVRVQALPAVWPLVIGAAGGTFDYTFRLDNYTGTAQALDVWVHLVGPGVSLTRGPVSVTLEAGASLSKTLAQRVPASAPAGTYTLTVKAGTFPVATQSDAFAFEKLGSRPGR